MLFNMELTPPYSLSGPAKTNGELPVDLVNLVAGSRTLPSCISAERPDRYPEPLKSQDFLEIRLKEIGLRM